MFLAASDVYFWLCLRQLHRRGYLSVSLSTSLSVFLSVCLSDFLSVITMEGILLVMCISHGMRLELGSHSGKILIDDALFSLDFALTRLFSQDYV